MLPMVLEQCLAACAAHHFVASIGKASKTSCWALVWSPHLSQLLMAGLHLNLSSKIRMHIHKRHHQSVLSSFEACGLNSPSGAGVVRLSVTDELDNISRLWDICSWAKGNLGWVGIIYVHLESLRFSCTNHEQTIAKFTGICQME